MSQLAETLLTDPDLKNGTSVREINSTENKILKKKRRRADWLIAVYLSNLVDTLIYVLDSSGCGAKSAVAEKIHMVRTVPVASVLL